MHRLIASIAVALLAAACASTGDDRGWTGQGAQPFDSAVEQCRAQTLATRGPAFEACMATKGWTRTP